jgi:hypothetical protein
MSLASRSMVAVAAVAVVALGGCRRTSYSTAPDPPTGANPSPAAPTPAPAPTPTPAPIGCGLPPGGGSGNGCPYTAPAFAEDINRAIAQAQNEHPDLFDFNDGFGMLSWKVKDRKRYYDLIEYNLEKMGYCAAHDLEEIGVKTVNRFNEQYQIMTSAGYSRWGAGAYRATCFPAWF